MQIVPPVMIIKTRDSGGRGVSLGVSILKKYWRSEFEDRPEIFVVYEIDREDQIVILVFPESESLYRGD